MVGEYLPELFVSDDIIWDLTNCVPIWSYNTGLSYGVLKTVILFVTPLIFMIVLYINIINKLWNSDKIEGDTKRNLIRGNLHNFTFPLFTVSQGGNLLQTDAGHSGHGERLVLRSNTHRSHGK